MAKKKPDRFTTKALNDALVRYGPEESVLAQLLRDAETRRDESIHNAAAGRDFTVGSIEQAAPQIANAYQNASQAVSPAFAGGGGVEASALTARMGEAQALAQSQLAARRVGAVQGAESAKAQARHDYATDRGKVTDRLLDLVREKGAFTTQEASDLRDAASAAQAQAEQDAAGNIQSERNAWIGAGVDPNTGAPIPGGRLDPNAKGNAGRGWASDTAQADASDTIGNALSWAKKLKAGGVPRGDAASALLTGADEQPVYRTVKTGKVGPDGKPITKQVRVLNPDGTPKKTPKVPQIDSQLYLSAALDMAYDGHLSAKNQKLLHDRGIQLEPLGLITLGEYKKRLRASIRGALAPDRRPANAPGIGNTGSRPT